MQALFDIRRKVAGTLDGFRERQRIQRIQRDPASLTALLRSATTILIVCHGNIIRSPFAARLLAQLLAFRTSVTVLSAGIEATPGQRADPAAMMAASRLGIDLQDHAALAVSPRLVASADVMFVMDLVQLRELRRRFPQARDRTFLVTALCRDLPLEIEDPFGGNDGAFHDCYARICCAIRAIAGVICPKQSECCATSEATGS